MTITAKFASICPGCSKPIRPGDKVEWERGAKAKHSSCAGGGEPPTAGSSPAAPGPRSLSVSQDGRRCYITGDTMAVRGLLRDGGCHWDAERKAWWLGSLEKALALVEQAKTAEAEAAPKKRITNCINPSCGAYLDDFTQRRGFKFCGKDCAIEMKHGSNWSGYVNGAWHQGSDD